MKTNKKLKLNTKKVVILSNEQQNAVQGGALSQVECATRAGLCESNIVCPTRGCGTGGGNTQGCDPYHTRVIECVLTVSC